MNDEGVFDESVVAAINELFALSPANALRKRVGFPITNVLHARHDQAAAG
jgi:hypothetical protein